MYLGSLYQSAAVENGTPPVVNGPSTLYILHSSSAGYSALIVYDGEMFYTSPPSIV